jgi:DNA repair protein RadD
MKLYPDQVIFVEDLRAAMRSHQSVLAHAATGFGKTVVAAYIAKAAVEKNKRVTFAVHRRDLVRQSARTFTSFGIEFGHIAAGYPARPRCGVQIATIETLRRRLGKVGNADLLYIDECHLACSPTWSQVLDHFRADGAHVIGNTATPARLDGRPLGQHFEVIVPGPPVRQLIEEGRLSDYRVYAPTLGPDLSGVHSRAGDYVRSELEEAVDTKAIVGDAADHYRRLMPGKRALAFCVSIQHSKHVTAQLLAQGVGAAHIDGTMSDAERRAIITAFADGPVRVLCNVELITTGFDLSSQVGYEVPVEGALMLRPTMSLSLWLQMLGRCMRRKAAPAIILDHVAGCYRHGLPDDERDWSLDGREGKKKATDETAPGIRICGPPCFAVYRITLPACPVCGAVPEIKGRGGPEQVDGELEELDPEIHRQRRMRRIEEGRADTLEALVALALERGYKPGWAGIKYAVRHGSNRTAAIRQANRIARSMK